MPILDKILSVIAPHNCLVCGVEGRLICNLCAPDAFLPLPSRCYRCKKVTQDSATCPACRRESALRHVWVVTNYEHAAKDLLHQYKFERARSAAPIIGEAMSGTMPYLSPPLLVVPVPTATSRIRQRGYDQAVLLGRDIARRSGLDFKRAVTRLTQSRQVGSNRKQRLIQLENAFMVVRSADLKGSHVLLVDDVMTTGATLETAAKVLKSAGVRTIDAVVFAQQQ